ncbi:MAG TPA: DEAD/DEAH box helicase, partial [Blastocatellia bacterium]|nr:DEAD/DEAH box helicase [Blastocatellia bacterium]
MSVASRFSRYFESRIQGRGHSYQAGGRVRLKSGDSRSVRAIVRGSENYEVEITVTKSGLDVSCTCPYFYEDYCKHIFATLLEADELGLLGEAYDAPAKISADFDPDSDEYYIEDDYEDDEYYEPPVRQQAIISKPQTKPASRNQKPLSWKQQLEGAARAMAPPQGIQTDSWPSTREIIYVIDAETTKASGSLAIEVAFRDLKMNGDWSKLKHQNISRRQIVAIPDPADRQILSLLSGAKERSSSSYYYSYSPSYEYVSPRYTLTHPMEQTLIPMMCRTGRCRLRRSAKEQELQVFDWEDGPPWEFWLEVRRGQPSNQYVMTGSLRRGGERMELAEPDLLLAGGLVFCRGRAALLDDFGAFPLIVELRKSAALYAPPDQTTELIETLLALPFLPRLDLPEELRFEEARISPRPLLKIKKPRSGGWRAAALQGELSFDYDGEVVTYDQPGRGIFKDEQRRYILRDKEVEQKALERLKRAGFREDYIYGAGRVLDLNPDKMPPVVRSLVAEGWHVEAEGKLYRQPGEIRIEVSSGIDWFELHGTVEFGDTQARLPALLAALKRGEKVVQLGDGTFGLLPEEWLKKYGVLAGLGADEGDHLRFSRSQVGLLDALLASQPEASFDETFAKARDQLQRFKGIKASDPPARFTGRLRNYQREGLGWLYFLQQFGFGGCLADDMGLGKTVMVLALLESRRELRAKKNKNGSAGKPGKSPSRVGTNGRRQAAPLQPSLVVVPKSLVFNWEQEAARFTPDLRLLNHTGAARNKRLDNLEEYDVVVTTYGTLRRDAIRFKDVEFDYVILDEAQAIKNASSESSKAARLLRGNHRLALSGTPVENHLGELWSLFEFLNPGLLGAASVFKLGASSARNPDEETRALLARGLRPFILRRTKEQVAKDLPARTEQTIYCELERTQRKLYDELRDHYRRSLLGLVDDRGIQRSKIQILEALLRLRQAACHPGLIDKKRNREPGAKLDVLIPQLSEVIEEGHKALVFSQFTSFLSIVRARLDEQRIEYEYLDGRTRDRASRVERFQKDPDCKLFLVSLKAGGLGLNLTAAEYVFLLDPWWNPAVEAQAIDRAHRIGQTRRVFA